jgi:hypothetical protein
VDKGFGKLHFGGTLNGRFSTSDDDRDNGNSNVLTWHLRADYRLTEKFSPVIEINGYHIINDSDTGVPLNGADVLNFGATDADPTISGGRGRGVSVHADCRRSRRLRGTPERQRREPLRHALHVLGRHFVLAPRGRVSLGLPRRASALGGFCWRPVARADEVDDGLQGISGSISRVSRCSDSCRRCPALAKMNRVLMPETRGSVVTIGTARHAARGMGDGHGFDRTQGEDRGPGGGAVRVAPARPDSIDRMGALGDSLSDEYLEESYDFARNWPQIFVDTRGIDFGALPSAPAARAAPLRLRRQLGEVRAQQRHGDLLRRAHRARRAVTTRGVTHATILIGSNDFSPLQGSAFSSIYNNAWTQARSTRMSRGASPTCAPCSTRSRPPAYVFSSSPPWTSATPPRSEPSSPPAPRGASASRRRCASSAMASMTSLRNTNWCCSTSTPWDETCSAPTPASAPHCSSATGPSTLNALNLGSNPSAGWVSDGVHPNTILQAVFADAIASALNTGWGTTIDDFSEAEMLSIAGLTYGGSDTLASIVGDYSSYIRSYVPVCAADLSGSSDPNDPGYGVPDGDADASDFFYFLDQFSGGNLAVADLTGASDPNDPTYSMPDGDIDADDFFFYLDLFVQGCD